MQDASSKQQAKQKYKLNHRQTGSPPHSALPIRGKTKKKTKTKQKSHPIPSLHKHWTNPAAAAAAKSLQSCPILCNPMDGSPPDSPIPGILQARTLEWVAITFSSAWKWKVKVKSLSRVRLLATPWSAAHQASTSMGFSRQEYWSRVPLPSLGPTLGGQKLKGGNNSTFSKWRINFSWSLGKGDLKHSILKNNNNGNTEKYYIKKRINQKHRSPNKWRGNRQNTWKKIQNNYVKIIKTLKTKWRKCKNQLTKT